VSLLQICQDAAVELKLPYLSSIVGNSSANAKLLLALCNREIRQSSKAFNWPQLSKELSLTLVASQESYAFASDHDRQLFETHWDRTQSWPLMGPTTPSEWQTLKSGTIGSLPRKRFRIKGYANKQIYIDPTPGSGDAGTTLVLEYQTKTCVRPVTWTANTAFTLNSYLFYNGNIYKVTTAGTTDASTAPTHTSSSAANGSTTLEYVSAAYDKFLADTDEPLIDSEIITLGVKWRFLEANRMDYLEAKAEWEAYRKERYVAAKGARNIALGARPINRFANLDNAPDTGYGA